MASIQKFEDLRCWHAARELVVLVYSATSEKPVSKDFIFTNQIRRASISVMNNIAEGFTGYGSGDLVRLLNIAQSSASEVQSMTYAMEDLNYQSPDTCILIRNKSIECRNLIIAFIRHQK